MDDSLWTWPAWKFDMKKEDLFTKLHDQYNTYPSPIQDDEAFYHDISEISYEAQSTAEFHHLASNRRQQRLCELNDSLESASLEIIGNPDLIKMPQWGHAVQLFRTNSLDSLVRYFASYLPADHIWHPLCQDSALATADSVPTSSLPGKGANASKRTRPQGHSSHVGHWEDAVSSGHGMSTMSDSDTFAAVECRNENVLNETVRPNKRLSTRLSPKQVDLANRHSGGQRGRYVDCQVSAQPITLTSSPADLSLSGLLRPPTASDGSIQVTARAMVGGKRKRS
ncbi:hypothetical protein ACHAO7_010360 [Fusarium culmorum]